MKEVKTYCSIRNGELKVSYKDKFEQALRMFEDCRGDILPGDIPGSEKRAKRAAENKEVTIRTI